MITENLSTLKIHKLTRDQYNRELEAGNIDENALYLTPDETTDLSMYAKKEDLNDKADKEHTHDNYATTDYVDGNFALKSEIGNIELSGYVKKSDLEIHNTNIEAHNDIRDLISGLSTKVTNFLDVDEDTTDQLSEVLTLINNNKGTLESLTTTKVNVSDIINNLTTNVSNKPLSAAQGVEIKRLIDILQDELDSLESVVDGKADENHGHSNATTTTDGFMSASDKALLEKYRPDALGSLAGKTISEIKAVFEDWISTVYNVPNVTATFSANIGNIVSYWNSGDNTSKVTAGATCTISLSTYSIYGDVKYSLLRITSYYDSHVWYVALTDGVWQPMRKTMFTNDIAEKASTILETVANPTDGRTYHIPFHAGVSTSYQSLYTNDGIKYYTREGTASAGGTAQLGLGNNIPTGTAGNKNGSIYLYGTSSGYTDIIPTNNTTSNSVIYLPSSSGTLALTKDFLPITGGTVNGHIYTQHPTGGETNIGVQHTGGKLYLYGNNSDGTRGIWDTTRGGVISVTNTSATFIGNLSGNANSATYSGHIIRNDGNTTAKLSYLDANKSSLGWGIRMTDSNNKPSYLYLTANAENEAPWMRLYGADGSTYTDVLTKANYYNWALPLACNSDTPLTGILYFSTNTWAGDIVGRNASNQKRWELFSNSNTGAVADCILHVHNNTEGTTYAQYKFGTDGTLTATKFKGTLEGSATSATTASSLSNFGTLTTSESVNNFITSNKLQYALFQLQSDIGVGFASHDGMLLSIPWNSTTYGAQIAIDDNTTNPKIAIRGKNTSWGDWKILPFSDGTNASGTWGINITGNAGSANKLATSRTISLTGSVTGSGTFDGSGNLSIATTSNHNHDGSYVNVTGDSMSGTLMCNTTIKDHSSPTEQCLVINANSIPSGTTLSDKNAPGIGFHIGQNSWGSLIFRDGAFKFINNAATGYMPVYASTFYGSLSGNATTASSATGVQDYNKISRVIKIGYEGSSATADQIKFIAAYISDTQIKDITKSTLQSWLGLGSAAYTASSAYSASGHTHDDRYYTESEINTKLSGKSDTSHTHSSVTASASSTVPTTSSTGLVQFHNNILSSATGLFDSTNNANAIITLNKHGGNYDSQLGFSNNGNIYYRSFNGSALDTTTTWRQLAFTDSTLSLSGGTMNSGARIGHGGSLYLGNADNSGWVYTQDIASHSGTGNWAINAAGSAWFKDVHIGGYTYTAKGSYALNTSSFYCQSWVRSGGDTGWYNETHGGGWYMTDSTWIRNYNSKPVLINYAGQGGLTLDNGTVDTATGVRVRRTDLGYEARIGMSAAGNIGIWCTNHGGSVTGMIYKKPTDATDTVYIPDRVVMSGAYGKSAPPETGTLAKGMIYFQIVS